MSSPLLKISTFIRGSNFKNMIFNIVLRIILYLAFFLSEFWVQPTEPFVVDYNEWFTYSKPMRNKQLVSDFVLIMISSIIPILAFGILSFCISSSTKGYDIVICQYKFIMSLALVFGLTGLLTDIIKNSTGRLRPDYISRCFNFNEEELVSVMSNISMTWPGPNPNCTNPNEKEIRTGRRSFPSGHSSISTASWLYLCLR